MSNAFLPNMFAGGWQHTASVNKWKSSSYLAGYILLEGCSFDALMQVRIKMSGEGIGMRVVCRFHS